MILVGSLVQVNSPYGAIRSFVDAQYNLEIFDGQQGRVTIMNERVGTVVKFALSDFRGQQINVEMQLPIHWLKEVRE